MSKRYKERMDLITEVFNEKGLDIPDVKYKSKASEKREYIPAHKIFDSTAYEMIMKDPDMDPIVRRELLTASKHTQLFMSSKARGKDFNLTLPDTRKLVTTKKCAYTGATLVDKKGDANNRTVERIDGSIGYVKGNVVAVTKKANEVKNMLLENDHSDHKMTDEEFTMFAIEMLKQIRGK
ncbi:Srd anti-sigma factor [Vibrio phage D69]